jgi:hypothetical protein
MARGEVVIVVGDAAGGSAHRAPGAATTDPGGGEALARARSDVERLVAGGAARGDAARRVAAATGIPRRRLYGAEEAG